MRGEGSKRKGRWKLNTKSMNQQSTTLILAIYFIFIFGIIYSWRTFLYFLSFFSKFFYFTSCSIKLNQDIRNLKWLLRLNLCSNYPWTIFFFSGHTSGGFIAYSFMFLCYLFIYFYFKRYYVINSITNTNFIGKN